MRGDENEKGVCCGVPDTEIGESDLRHVTVGQDFAKLVLYLRLILSLGRPATDMQSL
jgi:hypothetical protein